MLVRWPSPSHSPNLDPSARLALRPTRARRLEYARLGGNVAVDDRARARPIREMWPSFNMLRTPRERFSAHVDTWRKLVQTEAFEEATVTALLELNRSLPLQCDFPQMAVDAHQQMVGARKFVEILCSLHEPSENKSTAPRGLNYQAGV